jgi:cobalt-zinc-cadmium efflux system membrane fusion protein
MRRSAAALAFAAACAAGCGQEAPKAHAPAPQLEDGRVVFAPGSPQLASITTAEVKPGQPIVVRLPGRLVWNEERTVRVYPAFGGRVLKILAAPGDAVRAGQPLAQLASPDFGTAQVDARKATVDLALADKNLERVRELVANGVAPRKELNAAEAEHARARAEAARAMERVRLYGGGDGVDSTLLLRSPIAGTVVERNLNPGQELRPDAAGAGAPALFVITDPTSLWVQLDATERELPVLKKGETIELTTPAYPDRAFAAQIVSIADFVDAATRTVKVRGVVPNPERTLKGDMYVSGAVRTDVAPPLQAPVKAVFLIGEHYYAFVEEAPGRFRRVKIKTSGEADGQVGVAAGLEAGQRVVVDGSLFLQRIHAELAARNRNAKDGQPGGEKSAAAAKPS